MVFYETVAYCRAYITSISLKHVIAKATHTVFLSSKEPPRYFNLNNISETTACTNASPIITDYI